MLTLLTPNMCMTLTHKHKQTRGSVHACDKNCKDAMKFWNPDVIVAALVLTLGVAFAQDLATHKKLG